MKTIELERLRIERPVGRLRLETAVQARTVVLVSDGSDSAWEEGFVALLEQRGVRVKILTDPTELNEATRGVGPAAIFFNPAPSPYEAMRLSRFLLVRGLNRVRLAAISDQPRPQLRGAGIDACFLKPLNEAALDAFLAGHDVAWNQRSTPGPLQSSALPEPAGSRAGGA